jgi:hypothetical protein
MIVNLVPVFGELQIMCAYAIQSWIQYSHFESAYWCHVYTLCITAMAPGPFETHVYSLQSAFGVSLSQGSQGQQPTADLQENQSSLQSSFTLEGSSAHQHHQVNTVPWNQGIVFNQSGEVMQHQTNIYMTQTALTLGDCSPSYMSVDKCNGMTGLDDYQYNRDLYPSHLEYRCVPLILVVDGLLRSLLWVSQVARTSILCSSTQSPLLATPSSVHSQFPVTLNISFFGQPSLTIVLSLPSLPLDNL